MEDCTPETRSRTLAEALPMEQARVRELVRIYREIPAGVFAATMMENSLRAADKASAEQDTVAMLRALQDLQSYTE